MVENSQHIAFFIGTLAGGGAERVMLTIAGEFVRRGLKVDLLLTRFKGPLIGDVPNGINVVELKKSTWLTTSKYLFHLPMENWLNLFKMIANRRPKVIRRLPSLLFYLKRENPDALLSTLDSVNITALWAKYLSGVETKFVIRQAIFQSQEINNSTKYFERELLPKFVKRWYRSADRIITVSKEMEKDLSEYCDIHTDCITTIYNPVDIQKIESLAKEEVDHPWLVVKKAPVVLAVGRLDIQKDYPTLLKALKIVLDKIKVKLIILGSGPEYQRLEQLIQQLELQDSVDLYGFENNPYKFMARVDLFILSSRWEGLPNVLIEALVL